MMIRKSVYTWEIKRNHKSSQVPWKVKAFFVETPRWDVSTEGDQWVFDMLTAEQQGR
jgi:hypothetical protein